LREVFSSSDSVTPQGGETGMIVFYGVFVYGLSLIVIGLVLLACIPSLRLTFTNLILFVVGGFVGIGVAGFLVSLILRHWEGHRLLGLLALPVIAVGAAMGGACFVQLKTHFAKRH
jgi:hypothetical protein